MLNKFKKQMKNEKGLTLIELLAVVVILAIIAAIAIPAIGNIIAKQEDKAVLADTSMILAGAKLADANGECAVNASKNIECSGTVLVDYVEGESVVAGYSAAKSGDVWTVTYPGLTRSWKLKDANLTATMTSITEEKLIKAMGNK